MNKSITEKDLIKDFSSIEKLMKEWETLYPTPVISEDSKEDVPSYIITEPTFIYKIHAST